MLKSELNGIQIILDEISGRKQFVTEFLAIEIEDTSKRIQIAWQKACFSGNSERTLRRYFQYHLQGISDILDRLQVFLNNNGECYNNSICSLMQDKLCFLFYHLKNNYSNYLDLNIRSPIIISDRTGQELLDKSIVLELKLKQSSIDVSLITCLSNWLQQFRSEAISRTFSLSQLEHFVRIFSEIEYSLLLDSEIDVANVISTRLIALNFNYLGFFYYLQKRFKSKSVDNIEVEPMIFFQQLKLEMKMVVKSTQIYDANWPDLNKMLFIWSDEEIANLKLTIKDSERANRIMNRYKLFNNVSVAHLACLIQLLQRDNYFGDTSLTDVFKFVSLNYRTKRQNRISAHSLSKEFYSISQITAARVKDQLQRMIARINRDYFPVLAALFLLVYVRSKN